MQSHVSA